ncbi:MAG TPA: Rne/Rng family ribonuclease, partial [Streptosporangiaceae bacterium]
MLDSELDDREPDNNGPADAGRSDAVGGTGPAPEASGAGDPDGAEDEAGGQGRGLFRRGRRAVTRPAGPPPDDLSPPGQAGEAAGAVPFAAAPTVADSAPAPEYTASPPWSHQETQAAEAPPAASFQPPLVMFRPPEIAAGGARRPAGAPAEEADEAPGGGEQDGDGDAATGGSKRRRRGGRGKGRGSGDEAADGAEAAASGDDTAKSGTAKAGTAKSGTAKSGAAKSGTGKSARGASDGADADGSAAGEGPADGSEADEGELGTAARRRRRRRRSGSGGDADAQASDDPPNTVTHVRTPRAASDDGGDVKGVKGSTRLEAKRQRRREGRESGRRRPPIITESEFLARREAVERVMVVRQHSDRTQIAVLEDGVLVEHYVDKASHQSYVGNVYLGRVQNVLPSMEAAFVDIGKGRNAVLYAGEVNFDASGLEGESKRIESALKSGQSILVQATKDPIGHKGARLTSQVSLPGRYLVYVPGANMTGISRKLPDTERTRLKQILKQVMPENAGVIVRTAAEGATEEELSHDVARLAAQWEAIERKSKSATAPELLYSEPDLTIRVVRDIFNEDFTKLVIASDGDWDMVDEYVRYVAPNLAERLERWQDDQDVFAAYRIDEQIAKALERKVWLPSGGSLVIDTTEAMTVIDVNTGKFTGQGGNLEQTVTRNNLEAAEEIVRQLRVRDVGGIIVIDFIDMVLESNRDLVLRRLLECLARDRTKHQVAEVTSLGLVQMTRKRVGSGLLEAFSVPCDCCSGRGVIVSHEPVDHAPPSHTHGRESGGGGKNGSRGGSAKGGGKGRSGSGASKDAENGSAEKGPAPSDAGAANGEGSRPASGGRRRRRGSDARADSAGRANGSAGADDAPAASAAAGSESVAPDSAGTAPDSAGTAEPAGTGDAAGLADQAGGYPATQADVATPVPGAQADVQAAGTPVTQAGAPASPADPPATQAFPPDVPATQADVPASPASPASDPAGHGNGEPPASQTTWSFAGHASEPAAPASPGGGESAGPGHGPAD